LSSAGPIVLRLRGGVRQMKTRGRGDGRRGEEGREGKMLDKPFVITLSMEETITSLWDRVARFGGGLGLREKKKKDLAEQRSHRGIEMGLEQGCQTREKKKKTEREKGNATNTKRAKGQIAFASGGRKKSLCRGGSDSEKKKEPRRLNPIK